jgi:formylglycine-generating enzyme required for sulfatase activity
VAEGATEKSAEAETPAAPDVSEATKPAAEPVAPTPSQNAQGDVIRDCDACPELIAVSPGRFMMGLDIKQDNAATPHEVNIDRAFAISRHEITFDDWDRCVAAGGCSAKPSDEGWGRATRPVIDVSFNDITTQYLPWLSRVTGKTYRLPTEAEWEYAARGGAAEPAAQVYSVGNDDQAVCTFGNSSVDGACNDGFANTAPVGSFKPNTLGLYDMHGNVWEWMDDCWQPTFALNKVVTPTDCKMHVLRGGAWSSGASVLRSSSKGWEKSDRTKNSIGFRIARTIP